MIIGQLTMKTAIEILLLVNERQSRFKVQIFLVRGSCCFLKELNHEESQYEKITETKNNIEVWEDLVNIKDLLMALAICSVTTLGAYFIAPNEPPKPLFYGLVGALIGFFISSIMIKPKRIFIKDEDEE